MLLLEHSLLRWFLGVTTELGTSEQARSKSKGIKRASDHRKHNDVHAISSTAVGEPQSKRSKPIAPASPTKSPKKTSPLAQKSFVKTPTPAKKQGTRSATSNVIAAKTSKADGSWKQTSFFSNK
jgi:hypothetical protein